MTSIKAPAVLPMVCVTFLVPLSPSQICERVSTLATVIDGPSTMPFVSIWEIQ
jgi:hypothetical protein